MVRHHHGLHCLRAFIRAQDFGATRAIHNPYFPLLRTELGALRNVVSCALVSHQLSNLSKGFGLFRLLDRKFFDKAWQVFEVFVAFDWIYKLRLCSSAKEKLRFVFVITLQWLQ